MRMLYSVMLTIQMAAVAQADIIRSPEVWTVTADFEKGAKAREALSGGACARGTNHCFVVNDEKKYAQFFDINDRKINPDALIRLLPDMVDNVEMNEIDAEGVAYVSPAADGASYFYVVGSHGLSRMGETQPSRFFLFRFPVDSASGRPTFVFGDSDPAPEVARTPHLRKTITNLPKLTLLAEQKLDRNGVTIEGMAVTGEDALFGLRSPCSSEHSFVMRVPVNQLFRDAVPTGTTDALKLGDNVGIRDLASVGEGILILAGRSDDQRGDQQFTCGEPRTPPNPLPSVWFWSGKQGDGTVKPLGELPGVSASDSAETLLVLEETEITYRALVLFDGVPNGGPVEFIIDK